MFEPTVETGFQYLKRIQEFTGVPYGEDELQLVYRLYLARKKYAGHAPIDALLDQVSTLLAKLEIGEAAALLDSAAPAGDYDADGDVDAADYVVWRNAFGAATILYGSGADGNGDGKVDAADYTVWRDNLGAGSGAGSQAAAPEPSTAVMLFLAAACRELRHALQSRQRRRLGLRSRTRQSLDFPQTLASSATYCVTLRCRINSRSARPGDSLSR
jgi:hypothetical protein